MNTEIKQSVLNKTRESKFSKNINAKNQKEIQKILHSLNSDEIDVWVEMQFDRLLDDTNELTPGQA